MATVQGKDIAAILDKLRDQRYEARADLAKLYEILGASGDDALSVARTLSKEYDQLRNEITAQFEPCIDALTNAHAEIDALRKRIAELTICDCGLPLSTGRCSICDRDE